MTHGRRETGETWPNGTEDISSEDILLDVKAVSADSKVIQPVTGIVHPKIKIIPRFTHPQAILTIFFQTNTIGDIFKKYPGINDKYRLRSL